MSAPLLAIVKLTLKSALRSHVFQALLLFLVVGVVLVPNTVKGDGTAYGFIQVSIDYSIWIISIILSMSAVWLGCAVLSSDVESGQIHMVVSKPISRYTVFAGKFLGVLILHGALMLIASLGAFGFIQLQFGWQKFSAVEKARVADEVLTGRRAYLPDIPDVEAKVRDEFVRKVKSAENATGKSAQAVSEESKLRLLSDVRKQVYASLGEVQPGPEATKYWTFSNLPKDFDGPLRIRYKAYSGSVDSKDQKTSYGIWGAKVYMEDRTSSNASAQAQPSGPKKPALKEFYMLRGQEPERILCGVPLEFSLPSKSVVNDGKALIGLTNFDPEGKALFIQPNDGPKLLIRNCSFAENFLRAVFVSFLRVAILALIACAAGAVFSMPVAVFLVIAYIVIGLFASFLIGTQQAYGENPSADFMERFGLVASKAVMVGVMPLQRFEVSDKLANGELIELSFIWGLIFECLVVKGLPLGLLGAWLYWRRELALSLRR